MTIGQPYRPPDIAAEISTQQALRFRWGLLAIVAPLMLYPVLAVLSVYLVCFMEIQFGMRGATLGSFDTPVGFAFNVAAVLNIEVFAWMPAGFVASLFVRDAICPDARRLPFAIMYLVLCITAVTLVLVDPGGYFEYFLRLARARENRCAMRLTEAKYRAFSHGNHNDVAWSSRVLCV